MIICAKLRQQCASVATYTGQRNAGGLFRNNDSTCTKYIKHTYFRDSMYAAYETMWDETVIIIIMQSCCPPLSYIEFFYDISFKIRTCIFIAIKPFVAEIKVFIEFKKSTLWKEWTYLESVFK